MTEKLYHNHDVLEWAKRQPDIDELFEAVDGVETQQALQTIAEWVDERVEEDEDAQTETCWSTYCSYLFGREYHVLLIYAYILETILNP